MVVCVAVTEEDGSAAFLVHARIRIRTRDGRGRASAPGFLGKDLSDVVD